MKKKKSISYAKWGYIFILPFFITFLIFSLIPLVDTVRYSFYEYYRSGIKEIGPNFIGMANYLSLLKSDMFKYSANTLILWVIGFVPQIVIALVLACWFTDARLKIHGQQFFKVVIYLPNLIMASAFALLFFTMFSTNGPINSILMSLGWVKKPIDFLGSVIGTRSLVGFMNFLMWFGNTTIMLMAAVMGISMDIFEASELDGCNSIKRFFYITLPLIRPILAYTLITSIIGGLQMFDVPQILTNGQGNPDRTSMTLIMFLNSHLKSKNYGMAGALSVYLFIVSGILCMIVYKMTNDTDPDGSKKAAKKKAKEERRRTETMKSNTSGRVRSIFVHLVLIFLSFLCLFFFYILIVNATRSHADLQKGFSALPGKYFLENLKNVANDGSFPMFRGILNSVVVSSCSAALCTYFSSLTAYGLYAYDFKMKKAAFTFIMAILVMPTQVTAMGFLRLITKMGMYDSLLPLIIPSIASPAVFYFMYSYLQSSLPLSLVEAARIDGSGEFRTFNSIVLPIMKPAVAVQAIFTFVGSWNNYFVPALIIQSKNKMTVPILIATLRGADYMNFDMGKIYMMITVAIVPIIIVYLLLSKYIIAGVTLGGVKE